MSEIEFTDRYRALGIPYPDVATMCLGPCEGIGVYPESDQTVAAWQSAHKASCSIIGRLRSLIRLRDVQWTLRRCDGYHFIQCQSCHGTGKRL